jgi:hypothetical protein
MSRWISTDRPSTFPPLSRALRVFVEPGSIPYSAVSQPFPLPTRKSGTFGSTQHVQRTVVRPIFTRTEPGALPVYFRLNESGRSSSGRRSFGRVDIRVFTTEGTESTEEKQESIVEKITFFVSSSVLSVPSVVKLVLLQQPFQHRLLGV